MRRRAFFRALAALALLGESAAVEFAPVRRGLQLIFPFDHGAHPDFRSEWWYATGWLDLADGQRIGFQGTFFRVRTGIGEDNESAFAPRQLLLAHAAIADPRFGRLRIAQRAARVGFGHAGFASGRTAVRIGGWHLEQTDDRYHLEIQADESNGFAYALTLAPDGPPLLNGQSGFSAKAADAVHASYYYSRPQLKVSGAVTLAGRAHAASGLAWLDHEWSSAPLPDAAQGWDWIGINLDDGGALMAFRLRRADGTALWSAATLREAGVTTLAPEAVVFEPGRLWRSPRTGIAFPVEWNIRVGARIIRVRPLLDDQELDSRQTTGSVYWEGAVVASEYSREIGRGYLEMTGYGGRISIG
jgi:predicted secreted hydrolase